MRLVWYPVVSIALLLGLACDSSTPPPEPEPAPAPKAAAPSKPTPPAATAPAKKAEQKKAVLDSWVWPEGKGEARDLKTDSTACQKKADADYPGEKKGLARLGAYGNCMLELGWDNTKRKK